MEPIRYLPTAPGAAKALRIEIRCAGCGYGGVVAHLPTRCPMCGGAVWRELARLDRLLG